MTILISTLCFTIHRVVISCFACLFYEINWIFEFLSDGIKYLPIWLDNEKVNVQYERCEGNKSVLLIRLQKKGKPYIIIIRNLVVDGNLHFKRGLKLKFTERELKPTEVWL